MSTEWSHKSAAVEPGPQEINAGASENPSPTTSAGASASAEATMFKGASSGSSKRKVYVAIVLVVLAAAGVTATILILARGRGQTTKGEDQSPPSSPSAPVAPPSLRPPSTTEPSQPPVTDPPVPAPVAPPVNETSAPVAGTFPPTAFPTIFPSASPSTTPPLDPFADPEISDLPYTRYYAIGDVPYTAEEAIDLNEQVLEIPTEAEFVIHVGDIRSARDGRRCTYEEFEYVANILKRSKVPIFIIIGDNEWNDCPNIDEAKGYWHDIYESFEDNWAHKFNVIRQEGRRENFAFVNRGTIFIGINLVGGRVHDEVEWSSRQIEQIEWIKELVTFYRRYRADKDGEDIVSVQIFAHANPSFKHDIFFDALTDFIVFEMDNAVPFFYLNGDGHVWRHEDNFYGQPNFLRIQVEGGTSEPPVQFTISNKRDRRSARPLDVIRYDRQL